MLAILGLIGVAISALVVMDTDNIDDDASLESDSDTLSAGQPLVPVVPFSSAVFTDDFAEDETTDLVTFTGGVDVFEGSDGDDFAFTEDGDDTVFGNGGDDSLDAGRGDDFVDGGDGDDVLKGHVGDDTLVGGRGDDQLMGGDGNDYLVGGIGDDALEGSLGKDTLVGGAGEDTLFGGSDNDVVDGSDDNMKDYLNGGHGDDLIIGGTDDFLSGSEGADTFRLADDTVGAFVDDFSADEDVIELVFEGDIPPVLSTVQTDDGLALLADGQVVTTLAGVDSLDLSLVSLIAA